MLEGLHVGLYHGHPSRYLTKLFAQCVLHRQTAMQPNQRYDASVMNSSVQGAYLSADAEWLVLCDVLPCDQFPYEDAVAPYVSLDGRTLMTDNLDREQRRTSIHGHMIQSADSPSTPEHQKMLARPQCRHKSSASNEFMD